MNQYCIYLIVFHIVSFTIYIKWQHLPQYASKDDSLVPYVFEDSNVTTVALKK